MVELKIMLVVVVFRVCLARGLTLVDLAVTTKVGHN